MSVRRWMLLTAGLLLGAAWPVEAGQLGALAAPGPLTKAHAAVATQCTQCHVAGRKVPASKCLTCHKPIADRMARKIGVHRGVTDDCTTCHSEHVGAEADIRRFDVQKFNHATDAGYALDGQHAPLARKCSACHKTRSFLAAKPACSTCHADPHKSALGANCASCHSTAVSFKQTRSSFDHNRARFTLTGAHLKVTCEKCHVGGQFRGVQFGTCASCHQDPHKARFGPTCTNCHVTDQWATKSVEHNKTRFPLEGAHAQVPCAKCHQTGMIKPIKFDTCASCHVNVHRDSVKDDCRVCHTVSTFTKAPFDHATRTTFPLVGKHAPLECRKCHTSIAAASDVPLAKKVIDFGGASAQCASCHTDKHAGQYGRLCEACHVATGFSVSGFTHPRTPEFFTANHAAVACVRCHGAESRLLPVHTPAVPIPPQPKTPPMECASCHTDPHLGQLGLSCARCHGIDGVRFAAVRFAHDTAAFPLTGKHKSLECAKCHPTVARAFPSGTGTAVQFRLPSTTCVGCHQDQHLGQVGVRCETCHTTTTFNIGAYKHRGFEDFFAGIHGSLACNKCHKKETGLFPAGRGTTVRFTVGTTCVACHNKF